MLGGAAFQAGSPSGECKCRVGKPSPRFRVLLGSLPPQTKGDSLSKAPGSHPEVWEPARLTSPSESWLAFEAVCQGHRGREWGWRSTPLSQADTECGRDAHPGQNPRSPRARCVQGLHRGRPMLNSAPCAPSPPLPLQDAWSDQKGQIHLDAQQDYQLLRAQRTREGLSLLFKRPFGTCDPKDYLIEVGGSPLAQETVGCVEPSRIPGRYPWAGRAQRAWIPEAAGWGQGRWGETSSAIGI